MKHNIWKKITGLTTAALCMTAVMAMPVSAAKLSDDLLEQVETNSQSLVESLTSFTDEEMETYLEESEGFVVGAITAWQDVKDEVGALEEVGDAEVTYDDETITCTMDAAFEKYDAEVVVTYNMEDYSTRNITFNVDYPMSYNMAQAGRNAILGIVVVFFMLIFLTFVISLFGKIAGKGSEKKEEAKPSAPAPVPAPAAVEEELVDDTELVAVIAAAIAAAENTSTDAFVVRSIKKVNKKRWQRA